MHICSFPHRVLSPQYSRKTRHSKRAQETGGHCYVVVRRGPRPSIEDFAHHLDDQHAEDALRVAASRTKEGILDILRAGSSKTDIPFGEELDDNDSLESSGHDALDDPRAKEELLKILPDVLRNEMLAHDTDGEANEHSNKAMQLAQDVLWRSADMGQEATQAAQETSAEESLRLASTLLDQQRHAFRDDDDDNNNNNNERYSAEQHSLLLDHGGAASVSNEEAMRIESYEWPRLVLTPIKRSGHVTVDACTASGSIDRFTLAKSMGRQVYQDARKAVHGDLLPYLPRGAVRHTDGASESVALVKSLVTRVPAASITSRNTQPPNAKLSSRATKAASGFSGKAIRWPDNSAEAIGPDRVSGPSRSSQALGHQEGFVSQGRRMHYKDAAQSPRGLSGHSDGSKRQNKRDSRKRSLADYADEIQYLDENNIPG